MRILLFRIQFERTKKIIHRIQFKGLRTSIGVIIVHNDFDFDLGEGVHRVNKNRHVLKMNSDEVGEVESFEYL